MANKEKGELKSQVSELTAELVILKQQLEGAGEVAIRKGWGGSNYQVLEYFHEIVEYDGLHLYRGGLHMISFQKDGSTLSPSELGLNQG